MSYPNTLARKLLLAMKASVLLFATLIFSSVAISQETDDEVEEVVVTGSAIKGTPENSPNPVSTITQEDLLLSGSPSLLEILKTLPGSSGVDGSTNQFQSNGLEGVKNVNLRGMGPGRTLALVNGKRRAFNGVSVTQQGYQAFVNLNVVPMAAIARVEVLRDGASAIYGSDALAGVVNFITRSNFEGVEVGFGHNAIDGSDGDTNYNILAGLNFDENGQLLISYSAYSRGELQTLDRPETLYSYADNAQGGWSGVGNPGSIVIDSDVTPSPYAPAPHISFIDPACEDAGGTYSAVCRFNYAQFDNLVEEENGNQLYVEYNKELQNGDSIQAVFSTASVEVPEWATSPSYPPTASFFTPFAASNKGLVALVEDISANQYTDGIGSRCAANTAITNATDFLAWGSYADGSCSLSTTSSVTTTTTDSTLFSLDVDSNEVTRSDLSSGYYNYGVSNDVVVGNSFDIYDQFTQIFSASDFVTQASDINNNNETFYDFNDDGIFNASIGEFYTASKAVNFEEYWTLDDDNVSILSGYFVDHNDDGELSTNASNSEYEVLLTADQFEFNSTDSTYSANTWNQTLNADISRLLFFGRANGNGAKGPNRGFRGYESEFLSFEYKGTLKQGAIDWTGSVVTETIVTELQSADMLVERFNWALQGFGGANCVGSQNDFDPNDPFADLTAGEGDCEYWNPISNSIQRSWNPDSAFHNTDNPNYREELRNSEELEAWLIPNLYTEFENGLTVFDFTASGSTFELDGGTAQWAAGAQYRTESYAGSYEGINNFEEYPCYNEFITDAEQCPDETGLSAFLSPGVDFDYDQTILAVFGELALPVSDRLFVQAAARFEDYSESGSGLDPRVSAKFDINDLASVRGSFGTSFKAPALSQTSLNDATSLSYVFNGVNTFKAIDTSTDPDGLDPESSTNINMGFVFDNGKLFFTADYWSITVDKPLLTESFSNILAVACPAGACSSDNQYFDRLTYAGTGDGSESFALSAATLGRIDVFVINSDELATGGYDVKASYTVEGVNPIEFGGELSVLSKYSLDGIDHLGQLNAQDSAVRPLPEMKYKLYGNYNLNQEHNFRLIYNSQSAVEDERGFGDVDVFSTFDLAYTYLIPSEKGSINVAINNLLDEDAPFARLDLSYDTYSANVIGQNIKVGFNYRF